MERKFRLLGENKTAPRHIRLSVRFHPFHGKTGKVVGYLCDQEVCHQYALHMCDFSPQSQPRKGHVFTFLTEWIDTRHLSLYLLFLPRGRLACALKSAQLLTATHLAASLYISNAPQ